MEKVDVQEAPTHGGLAVCSYLINKPTLPKRVTVFFPDCSRCSYFCSLWFFFLFFQFLPQTGDRIIATAAADAKVQIHTVETKETSQAYKCHIGRVKRLATAPDTPYMLWSASEDGTIRYAYYVFSLAEFSNKFMIFFTFHA